MQDKKKYITLHYVSGCSFLLAILFFVLFLKNKGVILYLVLFLVLLLCYLVLSRICNRALQCEEGYSLMQAIDFYQACERAGYKGSTQKKDVAVMTSVAQTRDYLEHMEPTDLKQCYITGKKAQKEVNNPLIRLLWRLRGIGKKGGTGNV